MVVETCAIGLRLNQNDKRGISLSVALSIVGVGPGASDLITARAKQRITEADYLIAGQRHLDMYLAAHQQSLAIGNNLKEVIHTIQSHWQTHRICILASGDTGLYSIANYLVKNLPEIVYDIVPGISAYQYFCAKLGIPWHDIKINSAHGRALHNLYLDVANHRRTIFFTGENCPAQTVAKHLMARGLDNLSLTVGEHLSYAEERIIKGSAAEIAKGQFASLSMLLVENNMPVTKTLIPHYPIGIDDTHFIRERVPMTKSEVRAVTMSKLQLQDEQVIYDIGAGSGSVSIECALLCRGSLVISIERKAEAIALIKRNITHFDIDNIKLIDGLAPLNLESVPAPDRVFIGGTAGNMTAIIAWLMSLSNRFRVVINAVTIETVYEALACFKENAFTDVDITQVAVAKGRAVGTKHLMEAHNPIYILSANYDGEQ